ncbi:hypothetical protein HMPREF3190_01659 [Umbribacter vaginalis]|nr:hypothetical protein HMPREF3190_01659 [Coriobacteriales bacterium DNF00809]
MLSLPLAKQQACAAPIKKILTSQDFSFYLFHFTVKEVPRFVFIRGGPMTNCKGFQYCW